MSLAVDKNHLNVGHFQDQLRGGSGCVRAAGSQGTSKSQLPTARDFGSTTGKPSGDLPTSAKVIQHHCKVQRRRRRTASQALRAQLTCPAEMGACLGLAARDPTSTHLSSASAPALTLAHQLPVPWDMLRPMAEPTREIPLFLSSSCEAHPSAPRPVGPLLFPPSSRRDSHQLQQLWLTVEKTRQQAASHHHRN